MMMDNRDYNGITWDYMGLYWGQWGLTTSYKWEYYGNMGI